MRVRWAACHCRSDGLEVLAGQVVHRERSSLEGADLRHALPADLLIRAELSAEKRSRSAQRRGRKGKK